MRSNKYHFLGMHLIGWFVWGILFFGIFAILYSIRGQKRKRFVPLQMLKKRFASGQISKEEYLAMKKTLEG